MHGIGNRRRATAAWWRIVPALLALAACAPGAPRDSLVWTSSLGPFPRVFEQARPLTDPIFANMECTATVRDGTSGQVVRPTLAGRLNDPGSSLSFGIRGGFVSCTPPRLWAQPSIAVTRMEILTSAAALVVGRDSPVQGSIELSDGRQLAIDPRSPSRLRLTSGNPDDVGAGLVGEFEFVARDPSSGSIVVVRSSSFVLYGVR